MRRGSLYPRLSEPNQLDWRAAVHVV
jgi:hypothetical protein